MQYCLYYFWYIPNLNCLLCLFIMWDIVSCFLCFSEKTFPSNEMRKVRWIRTVILQVRSGTITLKSNTKLYDFPVETAQTYTCTYTTKIIIIASGGCSLGMQCVHSSCFEHELCRKAVLHYIFGFPEEMLFQKAKAR